jgi:hypothetical protein
LKPNSADCKLASLGRSSASNALNAGNCDNVNVVFVVSGRCIGCSVEILNARDDGDELRKDKLGCFSAWVAASSRCDLGEVKAFSCAIIASFWDDSASKLVVRCCDAAALRRSSCTDSAVATLSVVGKVRFYRVAVSIHSRVPARHVHPRSSLYVESCSRRTSDGR